MHQDNISNTFSILTTLSDTIWPIQTIQYHQIPLWPYNINDGLPQYDLIKSSGPSLPYDLRSYRCTLRSWLYYILSCLSSFSFVNSYFITFILNPVVLTHHESGSWSISMDSPIIFIVLTHPSHPIPHPPIISCPILLFLWIWIILPFTVFKTCKTVSIESIKLLPWFTSWKLCLSLRLLLSPSVVFIVSLIVLVRFHHFPPPFCHLPSPFPFHSTPPEQSSTLRYCPEPSDSITSS